MPVYRYKHDCGFEHDQFLKMDRDTIVLICKRCDRQVTAHQVRDKSAVLATNNDVTGVLRHEGTSTN